MSVWSLACAVHVWRLVGAYTRPVWSLCKAYMAPLDICGDIYVNLMNACVEPVDVWEEPI